MDTTSDSDEDNDEDQLYDMLYDEVSAAAAASEEIIQPQLLQVHPALMSAQQH